MSSRTLRQPLALSILGAIALFPAREPLGAQAALLPAVRVSTVGLDREVWPGDFNEDGITDLAGLDPVRRTLAVRLGGSGTVVHSAVEGVPMAVADLDRDGLADVVAHGTNHDGGLSLLRGRGDGTFETAATFAGAFTFVLVADFDGDGHRDLALGQEPDALHVVRGLGNFAYAPPVTLVTGAWPHGGVVGDFNGDGRPDIAVASRYEWHVDVFLNGGGLLFSSGRLDTDRSASDVAARDLDGDGDLDLAVSVRGDNSDGPYADGFVYVYAGRGDGAFDGPQRYATALGPHAVVIGDFTRDGRLDIATVNRSAPFFDDCTHGFKNVDSVSILPGRGDGTFDRHTSFALVSQRDIWQDATTGGTLQNAVESLNTADLDGDGHTDLIASHGFLLTNQAPRANRPPAAHAGDDWSRNSDEVLLHGGGVDPDGHLLTFAWTHDGGRDVPDHPFTCLGGFGVGTHTFTLTADDGQGGRAEDAVVFTNTGDMPPNTSRPLPPGWAGADVGAVGAAGQASYAAGVYTLRGSGADVWGSADGFHFASTAVSGDFDFVARVAAVQDVHRWVKAGLMAREGDAAGARHAFAIATPRTERGIAFQTRPVAGGATLHTAGPAAAPPAILWLRRQGDVIEAFYRAGDAHPWLAIGRQRLEGLAHTLQVGFAVSSHVDGRLATARFDHVSLVQRDPTGAPAGWSQVDIGGVAAPGSTRYGTAAFTLRGSGADVWGTADELHFAYREVEGDFDLRVRVAAVEDVDRWVKAGVMIRDSLDAGARHAFAIATPRAERGLAFQRRPAAGGPSIHTAGPPWAPPAWVMLARRGDTITAWYRQRMADTWVQLGTQTYSGLPARLLAGMAVSSHVDGLTARALFEFAGVDPAR